MKKEIKIKKEIAHFIFYALIICAVMIYSGNEFRNYEEKIKQLKQNNIEQAEEKEVYINRCKMYEDFINQNGLIDNCNCR